MILSYRTRKGLEMVSQVSRRSQIFSPDMGLTIRSDIFLLHR